MTEVLMGLPDVANGVVALYVVFTVFRSCIRRASFGCEGFATMVSLFYMGVCSNFCLNEACGAFAVIDFMRVAFCAAVLLCRLFLRRRERCAARGRALSRLAEYYVSIRRAA